MKHIPLGLRDYLPDDIQKRDLLIQNMKSVVESDGYQRIITPSIETFDQLQPALGSLSEDCIMFFDGAGTRLVLRPDHTTPIARIASTRLRNELPIKLYYHDPVFRKDPLLGETEIFQFGCEHIGPLTLKDEVQMIRMVLDVCHCIGLDDVEVHVAHPELFESRSDDENEALAQGDFSMLSELPNKGGASMVQEYPYLSQFFNEVHALNLTNVFVNFGLYKDLNYYNGVFFDVVSRYFGKVIGSGGRYDRVLKAFDFDSNAFGFALRLHYLERALND